MTASRARRPAAPTASSSPPTRAHRRPAAAVAVLLVLGWITGGTGTAAAAVPAHPASATPAVTSVATTASTASTASTAAWEAAAARPAAATTPVTRTWTLVSQGRHRQYVTITPAGGGRGLPMVVFLSGSSISVAREVRRDGLVAEVRAGLVSLVYPVALAAQWTVGGSCCVRGSAPRADDQGFVRAVVRAAVERVHPDKHRVALLGYSAGAKLAWQLVCAGSGPFAAVATYGGNPETTCPSHGTPLAAFIGFGAHDTGEPIAGKPTNWRGTHPPAAVNVRTWLTRDGCRSDRRHRSVVGGRVDVTSWTSCSHPRTAVSYAVWPGATHDLPQPPAVPTAASFGPVAWAFVHRFSRS